MHLYRIKQGAISTLIKIFGFHEVSIRRNVPAALKYLITNFSMKLFNSKFLSMKIDLDLVVLLSKQLEFENARLLYKPSEHLKIPCLT